MLAICPHCKNEGQYQQPPETMVTCPVCKNLFHLPEIGATRFCPNCNIPLDDGTVFCVKCGYDLEKNETVWLEVDREGPIPFWLKCLRLLYEYFPGLFRPTTIILAIISVVISLVMAYIGLAILGHMLMLEGIADLSGALIVYAQGVAFIMSGNVESLKSSLYDFNATRMEIFLAIVFGTLVAIFFLVMILLKLAFG